MNLTTQSTLLYAVGAANTIHNLFSLPAGHSHPASGTFQVSCEEISIPHLKGQNPIGRHSGLMLQRQF